MDEARELQKNLRKLMEGGDLDAVTLSDGKNIIREAIQEAFLIFADFFGTFLGNFSSSYIG